jgi:hypothetical protein
MAAYPAGVVGNTADNLKAAAAGENLEWTKLYQDFAGVAKTEGLAEAYEAFSQVAKVEKFHESRYVDLLKNLKEGRHLKRYFCEMALPELRFCLRREGSPGEVSGLQTPTSLLKSWRKIISYPSCQGEVPLRSSPRLKFPVIPSRLPCLACPLSHTFPCSMPATISLCTDVPPVVILEGPLSHEGRYFF